MRLRRWSTPSLAPRRRAAIRCCRSKVFRSAPWSMPTRSTRRSLSSRSAQPAASRQESAVISSCSTATSSLSIRSKYTPPRCWRLTSMGGKSMLRLRTNRYLALLLPAAALAGTGFDGTWKTNMESLKTSGKPVLLLLAGGEYSCASCNPPYTVKADGAEHKVTGQTYFDIAKVKVTGPNSADIVLKQGNKELVRFSDTVSADGTMLTSKV